MIPERVWYSLIATFSVSLTIFYRKIALLNGVPPFALLLQIIVIAALVINLNLLLFQKKCISDIKKIEPYEWTMILLAGFFFFVAYLTGTFGLRFTTSINYSFLIRSSLMFSPILSYFLLQEKMYREMIIIILVFFAGAYLVSTAGQIIIPHSGDLLILLSALFFALFSISQKMANKKVSPVLICWGVLSSSALYSVAASLFFKINIFSKEAFFIVLLAGFFEALVDIFMNKTLKVASVTYYYMMTMLSPIISGFLGVIFISEPFGLIQIFGGIIIILSVIYAQRLKI